MNIPAPARVARSWPVWMRRRLGRLLLLAALLALVALGAWVAGINIWAGHHFRAAQESLDHYRDAEALNHLRACLKVWPRDPETLLLAARAARRLAAFPEAESFLERYRSARDIEDDDLILEDMLLQAQQGEVDKARGFCKTLVEKGHPATPLILEAMANGYLRQFRLQDALACLQEWRKRQPDNPQVYFLQGRVYDQGMHLIEARASYRRALQLDSGHDDARLYLVGKLLDLKEAQEALPHLQYLRKRLPDNPLVPVLLARCRNQKGEPERAEKILDDHLERYPNDGMALAERGGMALERGQPLAAEAWLRRSVTLSPGNHQALYLWHQALLRIGKTDEARKAQEHIKMMQRDMARIQEIVTRKMQESPHNAALHYEAGTIALRAGALDEGLRWLRSAVKENWNYQPAHLALADLYDRLGNPGRAALHRQAAEAAAKRLPPQARPTIP